jgi:O26-antigen biosynthesis N-acetyl-L-fucosamine transferase
MRILIIADCYYPILNSGSKLIHDLGVGFAERGHEVMILTPSDAISDPVSVRVESGLRVIRVRKAATKGTNKFFRALREASLSSNLWNRAGKLLRADRADLIVFYSPTIFFAGLVRKLKGLWGCPAYLILRDIFPQWAVDAGLLNKGLVWRFFRRHEIRQYDASSVIGVQSPKNLEYFRANFEEQRYRLEVLYNWGSFPMVQQRHGEWRSRLGLVRKVIFFYGGNLGVAQDLGNVVGLAKRLAASQHIHFLLVGDGSEADKLKRSIVDLKLRNIDIIPTLPESDYMALLSEADVGLLCLDRRLKTHNLPGKLLGYMATSKPTLASINPGNDLFEILAKSQAGLCVLSGEDDKLCAAALELANNEELRMRMGRNSRALLGKLFSVEAAVDQIVSHFLDQPDLLMQRSLGSNDSLRAIGTVETD